MNKLKKWKTNKVSKEKWLIIWDNNYKIEDIKEKVRFKQMIINKWLWMILRIMGINHKELMSCNHLLKTKLMLKRGTYWIISL